MQLKNSSLFDRILNTKQNLGLEQINTKLRCESSDRHKGIEDWVITLIYSADTLKELMRKEPHWMYTLNVYA